MNNIQRIYDMCKVLKGNTINFYNNKIMSLDSDINPISSISIIYTDTLLDLDYTQCISMEKLKDFYSDVNHDEYIPTQSIEGIKESYILNTFIEPTNNQLIYSIDDLRLIDEFNVAMSKKAKDGITLIYVDRFPISICPSILPLNKSDKISLEIYNDRILGSFLAKFIIDKKKFVINKYIRYLFI